MGSRQFHHASTQYTIAQEEIIQYSRMGNNVRLQSNDGFLCKSSLYNPSLWIAANRRVHVAL